MYKSRLLVIGSAMLLAAGCTKLEEKLEGEISVDEFRKQSDVAGLLQGAYNDFRGPFQDQTGVFCLQDMSSDDCIGPTRGGDWDDNGVWRVLHTHTWGPENQRITDNFNNLLRIVYNTTNVLNFNPSEQQKAEALMLRAYAIFYTLDLYGKVPFRDPGEDLQQPSRVLTPEQAVSQMIADLESISDKLPDGPVYKANRWAAKALLMKIYLNKGVWTNKANPTFAKADMDKVIALGLEIQNSNKFQVNTNFFQNFAPNNSQVSKEIIFANENLSDQAGNVRFHWHAGTHYNQNPSGWNGFTTLASFYDLFEASDKRRGDSVIGFSDKTGMRVGFLAGQQYNAAGAKLKDRAGNDLVFSRDISPVVTGNVELPGIRVVKYIPDMKPDFSADKDVADNDYVLLRYSDVWLMMAEARMRNGENAAALDMVNTLRAARGATAFTGALTEDRLLAERGRELYWESWRRHDMIRFKKFLLPYGPTKPGTSDVKYLVFPIPASAIATNPNLEQNPGY